MREGARRKLAPPSAGSRSTATSSAPTAERPLPSLEQVVALVQRSDKRLSRPQAERLVAVVMGALLGHRMPVAKLARALGGTPPQPSSRRRSSVRSRSKARGR